MRYNLVKLCWRIWVIAICGSLVYGCQSIDQLLPNDAQTMSSGHLAANRQAADEADIPKLIAVSPSLPVPSVQPPETTHTVIVNNVPIEELIFSLARDVNINLDIDEDVDGLVTLNAINQPLHAILDRITASNNLTYTLKNNVLRIRKDKPYLHNYRVDYINMSRSTESVVTVATQINSTGQAAGEDGNSGGNNSVTKVSNASDNSFWETLHKNITAILYQEIAVPVAPPANASPEAVGTPAATPAPVVSAPEENPNIILNRESGILGVRATAKQHAEIELFLNEVLFASHRQVLIEATIAEVTLSDSYQAGIDWNMLSTKAGDTLDIGQQLSDIELFKRPAFTFKLNQDKGNGDSIQSTLSALQTFGDVKIMSSPKVMALNNQTALLKVVDNIVYFTVEVNIETSPTNVNAVSFATYETEINAVPVGFVMSVTPYISENDSVTLNVRPTISRVIGQARDPNPALVQAGVISEIPIIQVREVESVLKIASGDIAVMGGLMQDEQSKSKRGVPLLSRIPILGALFRYDDNVTEKTELVIFIRPLVIKHASLNTDLRAYNSFLPQNQR